MKIVYLCCILLLCGCEQDAGTYRGEIKGTVVSKVATLWPKYYVSVKGSDGVTNTYRVLLAVYESISKGEKVHLASGTITKNK